MKSDEIKNISENIKTEINENEATLGFFTYGDVSECYIKANKSGLLLFASRILEIADEFEEKEIPYETYLFEYETVWFNEKSDVNFIEVKKTRLIHKNNIETDEKGEGKTWIDKLNNNLILLALIFLGSMIILGLITFSKWFATLF
jgi:hypothetical protein